MTILRCVCLLLIVTITFDTRSVSAENFDGLDESSCPVGWTLSPHPGTCLWMGEGTKHDLFSSLVLCRNVNAKMVRIESEEKYQFFKDFVEENGGGFVRLNLIYDTVYGPMWKDVAGAVNATSLPRELREDVPWQTQGRGNDYGVAYYIEGLRRAQRVESLKVVCEKPAKCKPGRFGVNCERKCNCHGQTCGPVDAGAGIEAKCPFGCQVGWTGDSCDQGGSPVEVDYFCAITADHSKRLYLWIDPKRVDYENIMPIDTKGRAMTEWCGRNNTKVDPESKRILMQFSVNEDTVELDGCPGKYIDSGVIEYQFMMQERAGMISRHDLNFVVYCNMNNMATNLTLDRVVRIKYEKWFPAGKMVKSHGNLSEKKERVELRVVDPASGKAITKPQIGTSVALQIRFGLGHQSVISGVIPTDCVATTDSTSIKLLDSHGCPEPGSPISAFYKNGTDALATQAFAMFALQGDNKAVKFHCRYEMCFGHLPCPVGCQEVIDEH